MSNDFYLLSIVPYKGVIIKLCRAYTNSEQDYEDYYQEVCLQIWRSKDNFKANSEWSTWVYRIALNVCMTLLKKRKKNTQHFASDFEPKELSDESSGFDDDDLNTLYAAIKQLSEVDRAVILLYLEEKPYKEIAQILGTNNNNIAVRIARIKERLKQIIDGKVN